MKLRYLLVVWEVIVFGAMAAAVLMYKVKLSATAVPTSVVVFVLGVLSGLDVFDFLP